MSESEELALLEELVSESVEQLGLEQSVEGSGCNCAFGFASAKSSPEMVNEVVKSASLIK